jgi:hypothetical protein
VLPPFRGVAILPAALGDDSGLAGAAQLVLRPEYAAVQDPPATGLHIGPAAS